MRQTQIAEHGLWIRNHARLIRTTSTRRIRQTSGEPQGSSFSKPEQVPYRASARCFSLKQHAFSTEQLEPQKILWQAFAFCLDWLFPLPVWKRLFLVLLAVATINIDGNGLLLSRSGFRCRVSFVGGRGHLCLFRAQGRLSRLPLIAIFRGWF